MTQSNCSVPSAVLTLADQKMIEKMQEVSAEIAAAKAEVQSSKEELDETKTQLGELEEQLAEKMERWEALSEEAEEEN